MNVSGVISGIVIGFFGVYLLIVGLMTSNEVGEVVIALLFGLVFVGVGIYMLFHLRQEDAIEKVHEKARYKKSGGSKK